ncbi:GFA family protein [uncultured Salinisphaera sp.]|uniref:GFA family protein n=1 Tax=uncultured Salinisphaera sp. TaxID=359372 RepID=UPI0032B228FA
MSTIEMSKTYELSCDCGHVTMTAYDQPKLSLHCHCGSCRDLYNVDVLSAAGWAHENVELPDQSRLFVHKVEGKQMTRYGCPKCGLTMYGVHKPGIPVIPHGLFRKANGGKLPDEIAPTLHLFYRERVLDIDDGLEKCEDGSAVGLSG